MNTLSLMEFKDKMVLNFKQRWKYMIFVFISTIFFAFLFNKNEDYPLKLFLPLVLISEFIIFILDDKIHKNAFIIILGLGLCFCFTSPILDVPDESTHLARALFVSEGNLGMYEDNSQVNISKDYEEYYNQMKKNLFNNTLSEISHSENQINQITVKATIAYSFVSYLPQAAALFLGKCLNLNLFWSFYIGRVFNLLLYAILVFYAIKLSPEYKVQMMIIAIMPMAIYIAASYNQDSFALGMTFLGIGYFLKLLLGCKKIKIHQIAIFFLICSCIAFTKLPFVFLVFLILFIPRSRFYYKKYYFLGFVAILLVGIVSMAWFIYYSHFTAPHVPEGIGAAAQISYFLNHFEESIQNFIRALFAFSVYGQTLFTFGWFTYASPELMILYFFFLGGVVFGYPTEHTIPKLSRIGAILVFFTCYIMVCVTMYLTWTPIGATNIVGVQGRYFVAMLALLPLFCSINKKKLLSTENKLLERNNLFFTTIAVVFLIAVDCLTIGIYY